VLSLKLVKAAQSSLRQLCVNHARMAASTAQIDAKKRKADDLFAMLKNGDLTIKYNNGSVQVQVTVAEATCS
jgi:hypothetical protein